MEEEDLTVPQEGDSPQATRARAKLALARAELQEIERKTIGDTLKDGTRLCCEHHYNYILRKRKAYVKRWDTFLTDYAVVDAPQQETFLTPDRGDEPARTAWLDEDETE